MTLGNVILDFIISISSFGVLGCVIALVVHTIASLHQYRLSITNS